MILQKCEGHPTPTGLLFFLLLSFQMCFLQNGKEGKVSVSSLTEELSSHGDHPLSSKEKLFHLGRLMQIKWEAKVTSDEKAFASIFFHIFSPNILGLLFVSYIYKNYKLTFQHVCILLNVFI